MESKEKEISERVRSYGEFLDGVCNKLLQKSETIINNVSEDIVNREYMRKETTEGLSEIVDKFLSIIREYDPEGFISLMEEKSADDFLRFVLMSDKDGNKYILISERGEKIGVYHLSRTGKISPFEVTNPKKALPRDNNPLRPSGIWRIPTERLVEGYVLKTCPDLLDKRFSYSWGTAIRNHSEEYEIIEIHDKEIGIIWGIEPNEIANAISRPFNENFNNPFSIVTSKNTEEDINKFMSIPYLDRLDSQELAFDFLKKYRTNILAELNTEEIIFRTDKNGYVISILWNQSNEENKYRAFLPDGREVWVDMDKIYSETRPSGGFEILDASSRLLDLGYYPRIINMMK